MKCRFYSTQERLSIGDYGWEWRLEQKGRAFARSEPVGRPVPCGCGEISSRIRNFYVVGKHSLRRQDAAHIAQRQYYEYYGPAFRTTFNLCLKTCFVFTKMIKL